jgi:hypothetical protein
MLMMILAAAAAPAPPHPSPLKVFRDWIVGCDNGRACHAVALMPENGGDGGATMAVHRGPEAGAPPEIDFTLDGDGAAGLAAGGKTLPVRLVRQADGATVAPADVPAVIAALRTAPSLEILDSKGGALGTVSLAGASAALLYMDAAQERVGNVTALARPGTLPAERVPPPPPLPVIRSVRIGNGLPSTLTPARLAALRKEQGCTLDEVGGPDTVETYALDSGRTLILLACGSGAYNVSVVPLIATRDGSGLRIAPAAFDSPPEAGDDGKPVLTNAEWDPKAERLSGYDKGRGVGDCGVTQKYAWDGARFRLVEQNEMSECRGSVDYITTWRARVVRP